MIFAHFIQAASTLPNDASALKSSISALEISLSALEREIATLESSSTPWEHWAWLFTALVLFGVLLELWVIRHDWHDEWEIFAIWHFVGVTRSPSRPPRLKLWIEVASVLLIGIGIAGELGTGIEVALINGVLRGKSAELRSKGDELRSTSDQLLALVTEQAGDAENSAKTAREAADRAKEVADAADTRAKSVEATAKKLDVRLTTAGQKLDTVEKKRAELETSLRNLATCTAPRVIPVWNMGGPNGRHTYNEALLPFHEWTALIEYVPNDAETFRAASSLRNAFQHAGWNVPELKDNAPLLSEGVEVQGFDLTAEDFLHSEPDVWAETRAQDVAGVVVRFLHSYNWKAERGRMNGDDAARKILPQQGIKIVVGLYPPVWFVAPPAMKDWSAVIGEEEKKRDEAEQKAEQARKDSDAKILSQLNPRMAEIFKKDFEAAEQRREQERKDEMQMRSPCRPLETLGPY